MQKRFFLEFRQLTARFTSVDWCKRIVGRPLKYNLTNYSVFGCGS